MLSFAGPFDQPMNELNLTAVTDMAWIFPELMDSWNGIPCMDNISSGSRAFSQPLYMECVLCHVMNWTTTDEETFNCDIEEWDFRRVAGMH